MNQAYVAPDGQVDGFLDIVSSDIEQCFVIQATTDFKTWVNVQTTTGMGNLLEFNDLGPLPTSIDSTVRCRANRDAIPPTYSRSKNVGEHRHISYLLSYFLARARPNSVKRPISLGF